MNAEKLMDRIRDLAGASGRIEKMELLQDVVDDDLGRWVLDSVYNPFKTYGIKVPPPDKIEGGMNSIEFRQALIEPLLNRLSTRELTGNSAQAEVFEIMQVLNNDGRDLLWRILQKDLKAGVGVSTIAMVAPGLIPAFCVMRAQTYEERYIKEWPQKGEYKLDGQRNTFLCKDGAGAFFTRSGKAVPALDFFVPAVLKVGAYAAQTELGEILLDENGGLSFMLDGEAMMGLFEETGALRRKDTEARGAELHLYDMMSYADFDAVGSVGAPLETRRKYLSDFVRIAKGVLAKTDTPEMIQMVPQYFINSHTEVEDFFVQARTKTLASYLARGDAKREAELLKTTIDKATGRPKVMEGIMVKKPDGLYDKKKSRGWLKMKPEETEDLKVIGAYPGEPGTKYEHCLGGLIVDRDGVQVRCGGGFTDEEREALWKDWEGDIDAFDETCLHKADRGSGQTITFSIGRPASNLVGRLIEVEFHEVTPDGSLRHPRFVRFRDDKADEVESKEAV